MGKRLCNLILTAFILITSLAPVAIAKEMPNIKSEGAILLDFESGRILFEKNADTKLYPASTTKIMTAILAIESGDLDKVFTASEQAVYSITLGSSNMGLLPGEELPLSELLYGILVYSANEGCVVIAENLAGSCEEFVEQMNNKAKELGMNNTHFANPHGLHDDNHYTTARDLSILARYAMANEKFREYVSTATYTIPPTNKYKKDRIMSNTNHLISNIQTGEYYYKYAIGIKTGFTSKAGNCLVSAAKKGDIELIAVTLNAKPNLDKIYSFVDSKMLYEYGFSNYEKKTIVKKGDLITEAPVIEAEGKDFTALMAARDVTILLPVNDDLSKLSKNILLHSEAIPAPVRKGDVLGVARYYYDGQEICQIELIASEDLKRNILVFLINRITKFIYHPAISSAIIIIVLLIIVLYTMHIIKKRKRRRYLRFQRYNTHKKSGRL